MEWEQIKLVSPSANHTLFQLLIRMFSVLFKVTLVHSQGYQPVTLWRITALVSLLPRTSTALHPYEATVY